MSKTKLNSRTAVFAVFVLVLSACGAGAAGGGAEGIDIQGKAMCAGSYNLRTFDFK